MYYAIKNERCRIQRGITNLINNDHYLHAIQMTFIDFQCTFISSNLFNVTIQEKHKMVYAFFHIYYYLLNEKKIKYIFTSNMFNKRTLRTL